MNIRAGIIYDIVYIENLNLQIVKEIFFWSNKVDKVNEFWHINQILKLRNIECLAPVDFDLSLYFRVEYKRAKKLNIHHVAYYFIECMPKLFMTNPIKLWNCNSSGLKNEKYSLTLFNHIYGYEIDSVGRGKYQIPNSNIVISGTPDGIVKSSPGKIFDDYIVEIKFRKYQSEQFVKRNKFQICAYSKIFKKPVLLIVLQDNKFRVYRYSHEYLACMWEKEIEPYLLRNAALFSDKLLINEPADLDKYLAFCNKI